MTGYGLIASLAWTASAVLFVERLRHFADRWLESKQSPSNDAPAIPDDLVAMAMQENGGSDELTKQAQQSVLDAILDAWRRYGDWNKVRSAMGVAQVHEVRA